MPATFRQRIRWSGARPVCSFPPQEREIEHRAVGVGMIDTAHVYTGGQSEKTIGAALPVVPDRCVVARKGGIGGAGHGRPETLHAEIEESLRRLKTDSIPLYYLHRVDPVTPLEESLAAIKEYRDRGKIQQVGVSEVSIDEIERARKIVPIAAVQNHYNLSERKHEAVVDYCASEDIVFLPYFPLRGDGGPAVEEIAARHEATPAQIELARTQSSRRSARSTLLNGDRHADSESNENGVAPPAAGSAIRRRRRVRPRPGPGLVAPRAVCPRVGGPVLMVGPSDVSSTAYSAVKRSLEAHAFPGPGPDPGPDGGHGYHGFHPTPHLQGSDLVLPIQFLDGATMDLVLPPGTRKVSLYRLEQTGGLPGAGWTESLVFEVGRWDVLVPVAAEGQPEPRQPGSSRLPTTSGHTRHVWASRWWTSRHRCGRAPGLLPSQQG